MINEQPAHIKESFPPNDKINFIIRFGGTNSEVGAWIGKRLNKMWAAKKDLKNNVIESTDIFEKSWVNKGCNRCYGRGLDGSMINPDSSRTPIICECVLKYLVKNLKDLKRETTHE